MYLGDSQMAQLYNLAFHPAALQTLPEDLVEWPGTYEDKKFRSQSHKSKQKEYQNQQGKSQDMRGGVAQQTGRDIHVEYIQDWLDCARAMIQETEKLRWASVHPPPEVPPVTVLNEPTGDDEDVEIEVDQESPRVKAVKGILSHFNTTLFEPGMWFMTLPPGSPSAKSGRSMECTFADADMHSLLFQHYTGLAFESCEELVSGQGNHYQKDKVAHLNALAGGRLTIPRRLAGDTAQNAQQTSAIQMLESWDQELSTHINGLMSSFENLACNHGVALRIETCVEYESYPTCHLRIPDELLRRCVYVLDRDVFWHWKRCRLASMKSVMCQWMDARRTFTLNRLAVAGTLLIIMEYMMNALVNRPASGGTWDQVHDAACVKEMGKQIGSHANRAMKTLPLGKRRAEFKRGSNIKQAETSYIRSTHDTANPLAGPNYAQDQDTYSSEEEDQAEQESASPLLTAHKRVSLGADLADKLAGVTHDFFTSMENLTRAFESYYLFPADLSKWDATVAHLFRSFKAAPGTLKGNKVFQIWEWWLSFAPCS
ncbi:hypothetical protein RHS01_10148 [Rhizoctonia solani]|uniref:Uncharacterized protein n=1 Tax=Rhizoctonia solani TaxID=456999 RepID=A0A8H7M044_9AGAM|nr:hypothetical protein RHS01_10148 [Rhizoctonia solani]